METLSSPLPTPACRQSGAGVPPDLQYLPKLRNCEKIDSVSQTERTGGLEKL